MSWAFLIVVILETGSLGITPYGRFDSFEECQQVRRVVVRESLEGMFLHITPCFKVPKISGV